MMEYAINIGDLTRDTTLGTFLVAPVISQQQIINCEGRGVFDGAAVQLNCDEYRAEAIVSVIRLKWARNILRCYRKKQTCAMWERI